MEHIYNINIDVNIHMCRQSMEIQPPGIKREILTSPTQATYQFILRGRRLRRRSCRFALHIYRDKREVQRSWFGRSNLILKPWPGSPDQIGPITVGSVSFQVTSTPSPRMAEFSRSSITAQISSSNFNHFEKIFSVKFLIVVV